MATVLTACEDIQSDLDLWFQTCSSSQLREKTPFFDFIVSDMNNQGLDAQVNPGFGKIRTVNLRYFQRFLESEVASNQANPNCDATGNDADLVATYQIDTTQNEQWTAQIAMSELKSACRSNPDYIRDLIARGVDVVARKVATKTTNQAAALTGSWDSEVAPVTALDNTLEVRTLRSGTTDELYPFAWEEIDMAMQLTGYCDNGFIFSGQELYKYARRINEGCCANQGVNMGEIAAEFGKAIAYDRRIAGAFGDNNNAVMLQPGAMALLTYSANQAYDGGVNDIVAGGTNYFHTTIFDPQTGLPMDLNIKDDCGTLNFVITATTTLVALPSLFKAGDTKEGVNFANEILVNNA